jgi:hypothetical protein
MGFWSCTLGQLSDVWNFDAGLQLDVLVASLVHVSIIMCFLTFGLPFELCYRRLNLQQK